MNISPRRRAWPLRHGLRLALAVSLLASVLGALAVTGASAAGGSESSNPGLIAVGSDATGVTVDPTTGSAYVFTQAGPVEKVDDATASVTATLSGTALDQGTFDPANGLLYAEGSYSIDSIVALNPATDTVVATFQFPTPPAGIVNVGGIAVDPTTNMIYVANTGSDSVSVIDGATNALVSTVYVGDEPFGLAVDSTTDEIYVANYLGASNPNAGTISVINGATDAVTTITGVNHPQSVAVDDATDTVYVAQEYGVVVLDGATGTITSTVGDSGLVPTQSTNSIAVDEATDTVYVVTEDAVVELDMAFGVPVAQADLTTEETLWSVAFDPTTNTVVVTNRDSGSPVLSSEPFPSTIPTVTASIPPVTTGGQAVAPTGQLGVDPTNSTTYVATGSVNDVLAVSEASNTVVATIPVAGGPTAVAVDPTRDLIYVLDASDESVTVIDGSTNTVVTTIAVGEPYLGLIAVDPTTDMIYVAQENGACSVYAINGATHAVTGSISFGNDWVTGLAADPSTGMVWATDYDYEGVGESPNGDAAEISEATNEVVRQIEIGQVPSGVAIDSSTGLVYALNSYFGDYAKPGTVSVIDEASGAIATTIDVGSVPGAIAVDETTGAVYVADTDSSVGDTVSVIDGATAAVTTTVTLGFDPYAIAVDPTLGTVTVATGSPNDLLVLGDGADVSGGGGTDSGSGSATTTLDPGVLAFVSAPGNIAFPGVTLEGQDATTSASLAVDVGDNTGSGAGWDVTATATQFTSGSHTLPDDAVTVDAAPSTSCDAGAACTPARNAVAYPYALPAGPTPPAATKLLDAAVGSGMGDQTALAVFTLRVPSSAAAGAYTATWTLSLTSGP